ncbi:MAG: bifunctional 4-hydroxy-2-oxoglutarate aldolase/2-dehydro-3-deoxy-phosphogluconate aldolase [Betaproteobacteria bacterium]|nr:bifunctional 4-hydroxy-2-oxoglutarate aldolase/2-dehydro-3-deoxy-phosphogluconate aldolase [Betaproteobacteria bacterium]
MSAQPTDMRAIMAASPVMPVIVIERIEDAVPLARALVAGGIRVLEVTMRTAVALDAVRAIRAAVPEAITGMGTIVKPADVDAAMDAGAAFGVSPGSPDALLAHILERAFPFLPGTMTPTDVMRVLGFGFDAMKLFPAAQAGGLGMLKALSGPLPQARFCPTGGVDIKNAAEFLALSNVGCVGGSWLAPANLIAAKDWGAIERLAREAAGLRQP